MTAMISKWGNSQGLRVPKEILQSLHLAIGDRVDVRVDEDKIIIKSIKNARVKYNLDLLVAKIPKEYCAIEEISTSMGREEW